MTLEQLALGHVPNEPWELKALRVLLEYRDKHCPGYVFTPNEANFAVEYGHSTETWGMVPWNLCQQVTVHFPGPVARQLVKDLNSGTIAI